MQIFSLNICEKQYSENNYCILVFINKSISNEKVRTYNLVY